MEFPVKIETKQIPNTPQSVTVYYPTVSNLGDPNVQHKINHTIVTLLNELLIEQNFYNPSLVEMLGSFEIKNNQRDILSLNLIVYSFTGGAHGMTVVKSLTFNTKTGQQYALQDLFKPNSDYVKTLSKIIQKDIDKWHIQLLEKFESIRPDQDFYIADTSLVIYFQLYEITPYVWGFPYFPIAILDLSDFIKPDGPLDTMMAFT